MGTKSKKDGDIRKKIVESALALAVEQGWEHTTLRDIALHAELSPAELHEIIDDKNDVLVLLGRMIDRKMSENISLSDENVSSTRDKLFDILMDRFDVLNDYREGVVAILNSFKFDPKQAVISMPHLCKSMAWILEMAGIETNGIRGVLKVTGLTGIYLKVLNTWMKDDSPDLSKTMSALDQALERAERAVNTFSL